MIRCLLAFIFSFLLSVVIMPLVIKFFKHQKASQTILSYVEVHKEKNGTLTMGGVGFIITTLLLSFFFLEFDLTWFVVLLVSVFFGILGFMDDFLKIKFKQNLGLRAYQKIVGQVGISLVFAFFIYFSTMGGKVYLPFSEKVVDFGFWIIPVVVLVMVATTNSVNLIDGIDGLAGNVFNVYTIFFSIIIMFLQNKLYMMGETGIIIKTMNNINVLNMLFIGSVLGFLMFNTNKASIFMGDTGSLCLGGYVGASACVLGQEFLLPMLGFCFVFTTISVIMQVVSFKLTRKRIFKMAPFHHHLQSCGVSEPKIVTIYSAITAVIGVFMIIFYLL